MLIPGAVEFELAIGISKVFVAMAVATEVVIMSIATLMVL